MLTKAKPLGVYVRIQLKNPNYNPSGIILSKQAAQKREFETNGTLVDIGNKCEWIDESLVGSTVYFRPGSIVEAFGTDDDEFWDIIIPETSIHCYAAKEIVS